MNRITPRVAIEVATHEACIKEAYKDSVGVWTWGFGLTRPSGVDPLAYKDKPAPLSECVDVFIDVLRRYADDVIEAFPGVELTEAQFAAALSFHWNTGAIKRASWVKHFLAGDTAKSYNAFLNWKKPAAIIPRRKKERKLFFGGEWAGNEYVTIFGVRKPSYQPDWSSARKENLVAAIEAALNEKTDPQPEPKASPWAGLFKTILSIFGGKKNDRRN